MPDPGGRTRIVRCALAIVVVAATLAIAVTVPPADHVSAAPVNIGAIQAQMSNHRGVNNGTSGNCIRYSPVGTATSTTVVGSGVAAITAHGYSGSSCPGSLSTASQSAVGFTPTAVTTIEDGQQFPIGRMVHYNNPITADDQYFTGTLNVFLTGFTGSPTLPFDWTLNETPNSGGSGCCNDEIAFTNQIANTTLTQGGLTFRLVMLGFVPVASGSGACPATASGTPVNQFSTVEGAQTHACLYASVQQLRSLTIVKSVVGSPPGTPSFTFTSTSTLAGSPWSNSTFALGPAGSVTRSLTSGSSVTVTESDPNDDRWTLTGLTCTQRNAAGTGTELVAGAVLNPSARQVVLNNVPAPANLADPGITCTFTNTYTPKSTVTLVKQVQSGSAAPNLWTLTATGVTSGVVVSGPAGSAAVTTQRVPAGQYDLTETATGSAQTGYVQAGPWSCGAATVTNGRVTLPDSAVGTTTTCTVANRLAVGSLRIAKVVNDPSSGYTGGTSKTFAGTYDCGTGATGSFSTLTTTVAVTIAGIPAGRTCTVTETPPTGGLLNASFAWGTPTFTSQPVAIVDGQVATVTITNNVVQRFGTFAVTKQVTGPGGYTGGTGRVFPVNYSCTLTNGPTSSGTLSLTLGGAVSPASPIPTGSVCALTETLTTQPGDFADTSYVWGTSSISPTSVTIGAGTTVTATVTNPYVRRFGSLIVAKQVQGDGYLGGAGANFDVGYDCGGEFVGVVSVANGANVSIPGIPAGFACGVQELPLDPSLLSPAFEWGTPVWTPGPVGVVPANGSVTLTVGNPTVPVFGRIQVTKQLDGATNGVVGGTTFRITVTCGATTVADLTLAPGATGSTPDLPVGTTCTVAEVAPTGGLVDGSFAWGPAPAPQEVTVTAAGEVVPVSVTNTVVRVFGSLQIAKAPITPAGIVDPARTYTITYSCVYGNDAPVAGQVTVLAGASAATPQVLVGSRCAIAEASDSLADPPDPDDLSWVWLPPVVQPSDVVTVAGTTPVAVSVVNSIQQRTAPFSVTKVVTGSGKAGGYSGGSFPFQAICAGVPQVFSIADNETFESTPLPGGTQCLLFETGRPTTPAAYGWDLPIITVNGFTQAPSPTTAFQIPIDGRPIQINVNNPITPRLGSVDVTKVVAGLTEGIDPVDPPTFSVTLVCGGAGTFQLDLGPDATASQGDIPAGSVCEATEAAPSGGLIDASYAWGPATYEPANATVTVVAGASVSVVVTNPITRVTAPVSVVKTYDGPQGVVNPDFGFLVDWSCTYGGATVASGSVVLVAGAAPTQVADVPVTSACTATEGPLDTPSADPAFRWEAATVVGTTITADGANTVSVTNTLVRDNGRVVVTKEVTGAVEGYVGTGEDFTMHGQCRVPADPTIPVRTRDGTIADGGSVVIEPVSIGWTCFGYEDTPGQSLLRDVSYAWGPAVITPSGDFVLSRVDPEVTFAVQNPVERVTSTFTIIKQVNDPLGAIDGSATFTGTYTCTHAPDEPITGTWSITTNTTGSFAVPGVYLTSQCSVTEDDPGTTGLPDGSFVWGAPVVGPPATVVAGGTAAVTVTNTPVRLWGGLQVTKAVVDPDGGLLPDSEFGGVWACTLGADTYSDRFTVTVADPAAGASVVLFAPADERVPATATCTVTEDTLDADGLRDASFDWGEPTYDPAEVALVPGEVANLAITNTVVRVYSDVEIRKEISGDAIGLVPADRAFSGTLSCQYGTDDPVVVTWEATLATPALRSGILVGSVCSATEDPAGAGGAPVPGDSSYAWLEPPVITGPITVTPPGTMTPPIVVDNPTVRRYGTFDVDKEVTGAIEGIANPALPYTMTYECVPGTGAPISGELLVFVEVDDRVGAEQEIPTGSECTISEALASMPPLVDGAWAWGEPTFVVAGEAQPPGGRSVTFTIPAYIEDEPEPNVEIVVTNVVLKVAGGAFTFSKSSDPPDGTLVAPSTVVTYTLRVDSVGTVPVHDVVATDDLSGVLAHGELIEGSITPSEGVERIGSSLVWTVGTMDPGASLELTYQVRVNDDAVGITMRNVFTATGDVTPTPDCPDAVEPIEGACTVVHGTSPAPTIAKAVSSPPTLNPDGTMTLAYDITVTNAGELATAYTLTDEFAFAAGTRVVSASAVNLAPGNIPIVAGFNGASSPTIATSPIGAGETHRYRVTVTADVGGVIGTTALDCTLDDGETGTGFLNRATVNPTAEVCAPIPDAADLRVVKVADAESVTVDRGAATGPRIVYTITVTNDGPRSAVDAVAVDTLPGGIYPISAVPTAGSCDRELATLTCRLGTIAPGATVRITVTIQLPPTYPTDNVRNSVLVSSSTPDPDPANNASAVRTTVVVRSAIPSTGARVAGAIGIGALLLGAGLALVAVTRRRRTAST